MKLINQIKNYIDKKREQRAIKSFRKAFSYMGYDLSNYSDEELKRGAFEFGKIGTKIGVTTEEASAALRMIINKIQEEKK